ncbi:MAG: SulP family inorganic anion transporter [Flavobacteriia bacterium]|jgi:MFS superfamily sulfate permease-like transporter
MKKIKNIPAEGLAGLIQNWKADITSGFMVFLLALPLSLGIAKASGFPPAMGVLTAIIGGVFTSFFNVSALTIKGPAAGLITVCSAAVLEFSQPQFGGPEKALFVVGTIIVVMALFQILFGFLKFGSLSDFFPHSAVHGMLAAIGIIIIAKQVPVLLGDNPSMYKGETPLELLMDIPKFITHAHWHIAVVGLIAISLMFTLPKLKSKFFKKIPAPMIVLLLTIPLAFYWHFKSTEGEYSLVTIGDFWGSIAFHTNFDFITTFAFWKYVFMFLFVSSLESLLTVKAIDNLDPYKRASDYNGDLKGQGVGNLLSGFLGGIPMISEVVRSSSNVNFQAKTKWSNFFHGVFLLLAMLLLIPVIEMIPNAALAAMLIYAGFRLAAPKEFVHVYKIGKEQLAIFIVTIAVTLLEDLLLGIAAGIIVELLFHFFNGAKLNNLFKAKYEVNQNDQMISIKIQGVALFSNLIGFKKMMERLELQDVVEINFSECKLIDHSFIAFITHYRNESIERGNDFKITGLKNHKSFSKHPLSTKKLK